MSEKWIKLFCLVEFLSTWKQGHVYELLDVKANSILCVYMVVFVMHAVAMGFPTL